MHPVKLSGKINVFKQLSINNTLLLSNIPFQSHMTRCCGQSYLVNLRFPIILAGVSRVALTQCLWGYTHKSQLHCNSKVFVPLKLRAGAIYPAALPADVVSVSSLNWLLCPRTFLGQVLPIENSGGFKETWDPPGFLWTSVCLMASGKQY